MRRSPPPPPPPTPPSPHDEYDVGVLCSRIGSITSSLKSYLWPQNTECTYNSSSNKNAQQHVNLDGRKQTTKVRNSAHGSIILGRKGNGTTIESWYYYIHLQSNNTRNIYIYGIICTPLLKKREENRKTRRRWLTKKQTERRRERRKERKEKNKEKRS